MTYADRVASTREIDALALAVNQVTIIGDDDEQTQVGDSFGERRIELSFLTTVVLKAPLGPDQTRRMEELRSRISDSGVIPALVGMPEEVVDHELYFTAHRGEAREGMDVGHDHEIVLCPAQSNIEQAAGV